MPRRYEDEDDDRGRYEDDDRGRPQQTSGMAIFSLILGILSFLCMALAGLPAILLGFLALGSINRSNGAVVGKGLAITGIILGFLTTLVCTPLASYLGYYGYLRVEDAKGRMVSTNNLKQIGIGIHNYASNYQDKLPPVVVCDKDGKPLYSWRVLLLPYIEEDRIYRQFRLDEPWDSPNNIRLLQQTPRAYAPPPGAPPTEPGGTYYQVFDGPGAVWNSDRKQRPQPFRFDPRFDLTAYESRFRIANIPDGTSNTIFVVEASKAVPWSKPEDIPFSPAQPLPKIGFYPRGYNALLGDGSVRWITPSTSESTVRMAIIPDDGMVFPPDW